jgi:hypothetical protein
MNDMIRYNPIDEYFWDLFERQSLLKNHDVYEQRLTHPNKNKWKNFRLTPFSMFFYYVRINRNGKLVVDHYFFFNGDESNKTWKEIPHDEKVLTDRVKALALNARPRVKPSDKKPKRIAKGDFKLTQWNRISYIAIFFDEANWKLRKKRIPGKPPSSESAVTFIVKEGKKTGTPNHTFFDAIDLKIMMPFKRRKRDGTFIRGEDERSAIVFVNHMKCNEAGDPLGKEVQPFEFKMLLDVQADAGGPPTVIIVDPGGENGGPAVKPPPD